MSLFFKSPFNTFKHWYVCSILEDIIKTILIIIYRVRIVNDESQSNRPKIDFDDEIVRKDQEIMIKEILEIAVISYGDLVICHFVRKYGFITTG